MLPSTAQVLALRYDAVWGLQVNSWMALHVGLSNPLAGECFLTEILVRYKSVMGDGGELP